MQLLRQGQRLSFAFLIAISGCSDSDISNDLATQQNFAIEPPPVLMTRAVQINNLSVEITIGGRDIDVARRADNRWVGTFNLESTEPETLVLTWIEAVAFQGEQRQLRLARAERQIDSNSPRQIQLTQDDYETDLFDDDGDGVSNLRERQISTNPFVGIEIVDDSPALATRPLTTRLGTRTGEDAPEHHWQCQDSDDTHSLLSFYHSIDGHPTRAGQKLTMLQNGLFASTTFGWTIDEENALFLNVPADGLQMVYRDIQFPARDGESNTVFKARADNGVSIICEKRLGS